MQGRAASAKADGRLAELGAVQQTNDLSVVEPEGVVVERVADGRQARAATGPEGVEITDRCGPHTR